jgi:hypothetical protein
MRSFLICTFQRYNSGYKIEENEMDGACNTIGGRNNGYRGLVGKPEGQNISGKPRCKWEDNIICILTKSKRVPSIFKDESTGSCICLWKLTVAVATYVSICIVYRILPSFAF